ncbi:hypothetical protein GGP41_006906 [Bipolaris sorokiniana]|uniref:Uncharacterized protein n=1 Tax=Cochliobolus sativus TaxID=45130 RepID=A0A8H5ZTK6_COCSA|nr:hypothetical protein GGP41_006906 [Bipolaris sorokiniana]
MSALASAYHWPSATRSSIEAGPGNRYTTTLISLCPSLSQTPNLYFLHVSTSFFYPTTNTRNFDLHPSILAPLHTTTPVSSQALYISIVYPNIKSQDRNHACLGHSLHLFHRLLYRQAPGRQMQLH